jgi:hypothetical protein
LKETIDINIFYQDKEKLKKIKEASRKNYNFQIKNILVFYCSSPVEELANIVIDCYNSKVNDKSVIVTLHSHIISNEELHLRKVYNALLTKIPRLEYKQMIKYLIHHYLENN